MRRGVVWIVPWLAAALALAWLGCRFQPSAPPSIVLISLDTLRADHLSVYGYPKPTSPGLDAFASGAVRFASAHAQATGTIPSHLSLLSSLLPPHFRITRDDGSNTNQPATRLRLPDAVQTLAEALREQGYETLALTDGGTMAPRYGFSQGFDRYEINRPRGLPRILEALPGWLEQRGRLAETPAADEPPLFLFLHSFDIHEPYDAPEPFARSFSSGSFQDFLQTRGYPPVPRALSPRARALGPEDLAEVEGLYDNGIAWADDSVAKLFRLLDAHDLFEDSIVVVLSDHGDEFLEHGGFNHGRTVYQELVHVPLLLRLPGGRHGGRVLEEPVALVDVAPTLLEAAGLPIPASFQGLSLLPFLDGRADPSQLDERPIFFESPRVQGQHGLRQGRWKLIQNRKRGKLELYDLAEDEGEQLDRGSREVELLEDLLAHLLAWVDEMEQQGRREGWMAVRQTGAPSDQQLRRLRELGYVE